jgi:hypothetical protein
VTTATAPTLNERLRAYLLSIVETDQELYPDVAALEPARVGVADGDPS